MTIDVATTCNSGNPVRSGRVVIRAYNTTFAVSPNITKQYTPEQLETLYTSRFDHRSYYYDVLGSGNPG